MAIFMPSVRLVGNIATGVVLLYGGYLVLEGRMTLGTLTAFLLYLRIFFEPMQEISQFFNTFQSASAALEKISGGVMATEPGIRDPSDPVRLAAVRGEVDFRDVRFDYVPGRAVLPDLTLHLPAGQTVALVAPPVPVRPPSPNSLRGSTIRSRVWSAWTGSTCAISSRPNCAGTW